MKFIVAAIVVGVLLWLLRSQRRRPPDAPAPGPDRRPVREPVPMLRCATCGVHVAATDAVRAGDAVYCCDDHRVGHRGQGG